MEALLSRVGSIDLIQLQGRLDMAHIESLGRQLMPLFEKPGHHIVMSLAELTSITSVGLRLILQLARHSQTVQGTVLLCELQGHVLEVFETSGFTDILPICLSRSEALRLAAP